MIKYQEMAPKYSQLQDIEKQLEQVLVENQKLKAREAAASTSGSDVDVKYWRGKYHELLAATED